MQRQSEALTRPLFKESKALMIEWFMFGALGFFLGCLLGLMLAPPLWNRAVKLTTRRLEATMPMTLAEIQADKDQIRADFAIQLRKVEVGLEKSKEKAARELIEANKRRVEIQKLNGNLESVKGELHEAENANRVLQQTIKRRLPDLDARLKAAKKALSDLETVNAELRTTVASQSDALKVARATFHNQRADIDQLRLSLESGSAAGRGSAKTDARAVAESQRLAAELSRTQEELERVRTSGEEITFLRRELSHLASQILSTARQQAPSWQATPAQAVTYEDTKAEADHDASAEHEMAVEEENVTLHGAAAYAGNGAAGYAETAYAEPQQEAAYAEEAPAEPHEPEGTYSAEEAYAAEETGPAAETYDGEDDLEIKEDYETYEIAGHYDTRDQDPQDQEDQPDEAGGEAEYEEAYAGEDAEEPEEASRNLSKRFAARRAKRQSEKSGGSLTSRLRGLVADSPERRG